LSRPPLTLLATAIAIASFSGPATAQIGDPLPPDLIKMVETERAFAAHALNVGWKQAFLEYFADDAIGFDNNEAGLAKEQIRKSPDPARDLQLIWEPRFGDISSSGEIGYLIGPVQSIRGRDAQGKGGTVRHSNYASIWKRQRDGSYRVILDFGTPTPGPVRYAPGFTRAPHASRFRGDYDDTTPPLGAADSVMNSAMRTSPARAYRGHVAEAARLLRPNQMPVVGERAIGAAAAAQQPFAAADTRFTETARSGDLGYTIGTYEIRRRGRGQAEHGFYVRVWVRERNGQWKLAIDALQPQ
jgi:ketosteroid isomerase-like protein